MTQLDKCFLRVYLSLHRRISKGRTMTFSQIDKYYIDELQTNFKTAHNRFKCVTDLPNRIVDYLLDLNFLKSSFIIYSLFLFVFNLIALDVILFVA